MAEQPPVQIEGLQQAIRALQRYGVDAEELKDSMQRVGARAERTARSNAPVRTGVLQASIRQSRAKASVAIKSGNNGKLRYASFNEWGTSKMRGTQYVTRAIQSNAGYAVSQIEQELSRLARKHDLT